MEEKDNAPWVARDKDGWLCIFYGRPKLQENDGYFYGEQFISIHSALFPEVTFENSPKRLIPEL